VANPNKRRGTRWETEFARYLNRELGLVTPDGDEFLDPTSPLNARRQAQQGVNDVGDLWVVPFVVECKNTARHELPAYVRQAEQEARNAGLPFGVAAVKVRGRGPHECLVVMSGATFVRVVKELRQ